VLLERSQSAAETRQRELADALNLDKSSVARLCQRMETAGHVIQKRLPDDARAREVVLTAKGKKLAQTVDAASRERFERVVTAMREADRQRVLDALAILNTAVSTLN
jgi:DNA-binding MarR family transcriptional regulator